MNTFVGQVAPTGTNQLTGTVTMEERGFFPVEAQNQKVKDLTIVYGPRNPNDPVELGSYGPGNMTYVQDPSLEGAIVPGVTVQLKAKRGYHFVAVSFGVGLSNFGRLTEGECWIFWLTLNSFFHGVWRDRERNVPCSCVV